MPQFFQITCDVLAARAAHAGMMGLQVAREIMEIAPVGVERVLRGPPLGSERVEVARDQCLIVGCHDLNL